MLNPYGIFPDRMKGLKQATFNPMSSLDPKSPSFHADCDKLAEAICYEEHLTGDSHWITSARQLLSGIIAALKKHGAGADQNLVAVRNVITGATGQSVFDFCRECMALKDRSSGKSWRGSRLWVSLRCRGSRRESRVRKRAGN